MGKKKPDPEPPSDKIIRKLGDNLQINVTDAEKRYRNKYGPDDISDINKEKIKCTVCNKSLTDLLKKGNEPYVHMLLDVLMCRDCSTFYGDGYFSVDEDGDDKYCRWCGQGGTLYLCSSCTCAFCKKCMRQNLSRQDVKNMDSDDWKCLICNPNPLFESRTVCWFLRENWNKIDSEGEDSAGKARKRSSHRNVEERSSKRKSLDEPVEVPSKRLKRSSSIKDVDKSEEEKSTRRRSHSNQEVNKSEQLQEIVISDDDDVVEEYKPSPRNSSSRSTKKNSLQKSTSSSVDNEENTSKRSKRSSLKKEISEPAKSTVKPVAKKSSRKDKASKKTDNIENVAKRSSRTTKKISNAEGGSDENKQKSDSFSQLISLDDENSTSESDTKKKKSKERKKVATNIKTTKLHLAKNTDSAVVEAGVYINSAIKDVLELTVLVANRCEKLCSRSVRSNEDLFNVFKKIKQLMKGVHSNFTLIETGLDAKVDEWKKANGIKDTSIKTPDETAEAETKVSENKEEHDDNPPNKEKKDEETDGSSCSKAKENEDEITNTPSNDSLTNVMEEGIKELSMDLAESEVKEEKLPLSTTPDQEIKEGNKSTSTNLLTEDKEEQSKSSSRCEPEIDESCKDTNEMEVEDVQSKTETEEIDDKEPKGSFQESMDVDDESQNNSMLTTDNEITSKETISIQNHELEKTEEIPLKESHYDKDTLENEAEDEKRSDVSGDNVESSPVTKDDDESVGKTVNNDDSIMSKGDEANESIDSCVVNNDDSLISTSDVVNESIDSCAVNNDDSLISKSDVANESIDSCAVNNDDSLISTSDVVNESIDSCAVNNDDSLISKCDVVNESIDSCAVNNDDSSISKCDVVNESIDSSMDETNYDSIKSENRTVDTQNQNWKNDFDVENGNEPHWKKEDSLDEMKGEKKVQSESQSTSTTNLTSRIEQPFEDNNSLPSVKETKNNEVADGGKAEVREEKKVQNSSEKQKAVIKEGNPLKTDEYKKRPGSYHDSQRSNDRDRQRNRNDHSGGWSRGGHNRNPQDRYSHDRWRGGQDPWNRRDDRRHNRGSWGSWQRH